MKKRCLWPSVVALLVAASAQAIPSDGKSDAELLQALAIGTVCDPGGGLTTDTGLGLFGAVGLGANGEPSVTRASAELDALTAELAALRTDVANLSSLAASADTTAFQVASASMLSAQTAILSCAAAVEAAAAAPGSDTTDDALLEYARQITGLSPAGSSDCASVTDSFAAIHQAIVGTAGADGAYTRLARAMKKGSSPSYDRLVSHFIQYALTQRAALELLRTAYSVLGAPEGWQTALSAPPLAAQNALRDEEIALLEATDTYVTFGQPTTYRPALAGVADAVVQRLEGVRAQVSTYSLSILDNATPYTPSLHDAAQTAVLMTDTLASASASYYDTAELTLVAGLANCPNLQSTAGFSYVRPHAGPRTGFNIGSSCAVHVARHLKTNVTADASTTWDVLGRADTAAEPLSFAPRNAVTLADETPGEWLALAGAPLGEGSGSAALTLVPDATDPSVVSLAVDLPAQAAVPVRAGSAHPFVASGTGDIALFTRVPFGPDAPDRYALAQGESYLTIGSDGFAALGDAPTWFDLRATPDGHTELSYDGGVLYVDVQSQQGFFAEAPDVTMTNAVNIANAWAVTQWAVPADFSRPAPVGTLNLYPNCLLTNGTPVASVGTTECSNVGLPYQEFVTTFYNDDAVDRTYAFTLGATAQYVVNGRLSQSGGIHCWSPYIGPPDDHFDIGDATVNPALMSSPVSPFLFTPAGWNLIVPAHGSFEMHCQVLDWGNDPSGLVLDNYTVQPCRPPASSSCQVYQ